MIMEIVWVLRVGGRVIMVWVVVGLGAGWKSILWAFFGACARVSVAGGMDIPENLFRRCTGIKTAFIPSRPK